MSPADLPSASRIRIVLVGTQHPGNIGAAARAMRTMGLRHLALVAPMRYPHADAHAMAAGADDVLASALVTDDLETALADCHWVIGCSARSRRIALPTLGPREAATQALQQAGAGLQVALLFGRERTGLFNEELQRCHTAVQIPSDPGFPSLNLAAAVQVLAYELHTAALADAQTEHVQKTRLDPPASHAELEGLFGQLEQTLAAIDFHKGREPASAMAKLRRLLLRADMDAREVRLLRGVLADAQRMARLAQPQLQPSSAADDLSSPPALG